MSALSCSTWRLMRPATRSTNGVLVCRPGPATRTNLPKRSTIARSCCSTVKKKSGTATPLSLSEPRKELCMQSTMSARMREEASKVGNLTFMSEESDPAELVGCRPDEQLLELDAPNRPAEVGRPLPIPATHARGVIVGAGAGMTGLSLVGGVALIAFALVTSFTDGADLLRGILLALGIMLVATHWGWVHVAELSARAVEKGHGRELVDRNHRWLEGIAPYSRY